jgi:transposase
MAIVHETGYPASIGVFSATSHESRLVEQTLEMKFIKKQKIDRLTGDKAYDSDPLDGRLKKRSIELIAPHRKNRKKKPSQDRRILSSYKGRWKVERFFAWLQNFRRCVVRYEYYAENFLGMVLLACMLIFINYF